MCDYFVHGGDISIINTPPDYKVLYVDLKEDGSLDFGRAIKFADGKSRKTLVSMKHRLMLLLVRIEFSHRGGAKPHSAVFYDFADPQNPLYY